MSTIANVIINTKDGRSIHVNEQEVRLMRGPATFKPHEIHLIHGILCAAWGLQEIEELEDEGDDDDSIGLADTSEGDDKE